MVGMDIFSVQWEETITETAKPVQYFSLLVSFFKHIVSSPRTAVRFEETMNFHADKISLRVRINTYFIEPPVL